MDTVRLTRAILSLLLGLILGGAITLAHAETIPASLRGEVAPIPGYEAEFLTGGAKGGTGRTRLEACTNDLTVAKHYVVYPNQENWKFGALVNTDRCTFSSTLKSDGSPWGPFITVATYSKTYCPDSTYLLSGGKCIPSPAYECPSSGGWTLDGNQCTRPDCQPGETRNEAGVCVATCPSGYHEDPQSPGQCIADCIGDQVQQANGQCACSAGDSALVSYQYGGGSSGPGSSGCVNGCVRSMGTGVCPGGVIAMFTGGSATCYAYATTTGASCGANTQSTSPPMPVTLSPPMPPSAPDPPGGGDPLNTPTNAEDPVACGEAGGSWGTVNGVSKCLPPNPGSPAVTVTKDESVVTLPDGTKSRTERDSVTINPGAGGSPQVIQRKVVTVEDGGGNVVSTGVTTTQSDKRSFCEENPSSAICTQKRASGGGTCSAAPTCEGDAIECAILEQSWRTRCALSLDPAHPETAGMVELGHLVASGADPLAASMPWSSQQRAANTIDMSGVINQTEMFGASCLPDLSFSVAGNAFSIPLGVTCTYLGYIGNLFVMVSLVSAVMIIGRA